MENHETPSLEPAAYPQSIDDLSREEIDRINLFLAGQNKPAFTKRYIEFMKGQEFINEVKSNNDFLYRGKITKLDLCTVCRHANKKVFVLNLLSCPNHVNEILLLNEQFEPMALCGQIPSPSLKK